MFVPLVNVEIVITLFDRVTPCNRAISMHQQRWGRNCTLIFSILFGFFLFVLVVFLLFFFFTSSFLSSGFALYFQFKLKSSGLRTRDFLFLKKTYGNYSSRIRMNLPFPSGIIDTPPPASFCSYLPQRGKHGLLCCGRESTCKVLVGFPGDRLEN